MNRQKLPVLVAALLAASAAPSGGAASAPATKLRFDWPDGLELEVAFSVMGRQEQGGRAQFHRSHSSYRLSVRRKRGKSVIRRDDLPSAPTSPLPRDADGDRKTLLSEIQELIDNLSSYVPAFVVDEEGRYVRALELDQTEARRELILERAAVAPSLAHRLRDLLTVEAAEQRLADEWQMMVEGWLDRSWAEASAVREERVGRVPEIGIPIAITLELEHRGSVPCHEGEEERRCVELAALSAAAPEAVREALEAAGLDNLSGLTDLSIDSRYRVIVHPETMVPTLFETYRLFEATYGPDAPDGVLTLHERRRTWRFSGTVETP